MLLLYYVGTGVRVSKRDQGDLVTTLPLEFKYQKYNFGHNTHILE